MKFLWAVNKISPWIHDRKYKKNKKNTEDDFSRDASSSEEIFKLKYLQVNIYWNVHDSLATIDQGQVLLQIRYRSAYHANHIPYNNRSRDWMRLMVIYIYESSVIEFSKQNWNTRDVARYFIDSCIMSRAMHLWHFSDGCFSDFIQPEENTIFNVMNINWNFFNYLSIHRILIVRICSSFEVWNKQII